MRLFEMGTSIVREPILFVSDEMESAIADSASDVYADGNAELPGVVSADEMVVGPEAATRARGPLPPVARRRIFPVSLSEIVKWKGMTICQQRRVRWGYGAIARSFVRSFVCSLGKFGSVKGGEVPARDGDVGTVCGLIR